MLSEKSLYSVAPIAKCNRSKHVRRQDQHKRDFNEERLQEMGLRLSECKEKCYLKIYIKTTTTRNVK